MTPVGMIIMIFDNPFQNYLWTTTIYLFIQSVITFLYLYKLFNKKKVIVLSLIIIVFSFFIELTGILTSFPFGNYYYTEKLPPLIFGKVPVVISFCWYVISVNSYLFISKFLSDKFHYYIVIIISSFLILIIDILLEPFASLKNGYWIWENNQIPFSNYITWFLIGFLFTLLIYKFNIKLHINSEKCTKKFYSNIPEILLSINILQFLFIDILYFLRLI